MKRRQGSGVAMVIIALISGLWSGWAVSQDSGRRPRRWSEVMNGRIGSRIAVALLGLLVAGGCHGDGSEPAAGAAAGEGAERPEARSGPYRLIKDANKELCEANPLVCRYPVSLCTDLEANFNAFPDEPAMVCERKFEPRLGFTAPDWRPVAAADLDWELLKEIFIAEGQSFGGKREFLERERWPAARERWREASTRRTLIWTATMDLDNKDGEERVIRLMDEDCSAEESIGLPSPGPAIYVIDEATGKPDKNYLDLRVMSLDPFRYQGKTYLTTWSGTEKRFSGGSLFVYNVVKPFERASVGRQQCVFSYQP